MTEGKKALTEERRAKAAAEAEAADAERQLGRRLAIGLPAVFVATALVVGVVMSTGPALLVLVAGALLGAIAFLWASIRTLGGDAPLSEDLEALIVGSIDSGGDLRAEKQKVLRALKDLEHEHSIGKIDDGDFNALSEKYRDEAKALLRKLDLEVEPYREKAEALARSHLEKVGLGDGAPTEAIAPESQEDVEDEEQEQEQKPESNPTPEEATETKEADIPDRLVCPSCSTTNDTDAAFCKKCGSSLAKKPEERSGAEDEKHA